jgi:hypothetical protein
MDPILKSPPEGALINSAFAVNAKKQILKNKIEMNNKLNFTSELIGLCS